MTRRSLAAADGAATTSWCGDRLRRAQENFSKTTGLITSENYNSHIEKHNLNLVVSSDIKGAPQQSVKFLQDQGKVDKVNMQAQERTVCGRKLCTGNISCI